jgi:hypothetical protein
LKPRGTLTVKVRSTELTSDNRFLPIERAATFFDSIATFLASFMRPVLFVVLAALSAYAGWLAFKFSALSDYFVFMAEYAKNNSGLRLQLQLLAGLALYLAFALLLYRRLASPLNIAPRPSDTVSPLLNTTQPPSSTAPSQLNIASPPSNTLPRTRAIAIERWARRVIVIVPSAVIGCLLITAAPWPPRGAVVIWLAAATVFITAVAQLFFVDRLKRSIRNKPDVEKKTQISVVLLTLYLFVGAPALYLWIRADVIEATLFIGGIGIVLLFLIFLLAFLEALQRLKLSLELIVLAVAGWLFLQFSGPPPREFAYTSISDAKTELNTPAEIKEALNKRKLPTLTSAFHDWFDKRFPPKERDGRKYPVFIVAAQGGGLYAAYHTALSLARLYDSCPKLKDHVFAVSGVSGGSFGAAMFSEMLRDQAALGDACSDQSSDGKLEHSVREFFQFDFVTPVIASGLLFDVPALINPSLLRPTHDRAHTLELAFDNAFHYATQHESSSTNFYGSWKADGVAPALFLNATSANYGRPVLLSQLYMTDEHSYADFSRVEEIVRNKFGPATVGDDKRAQEAQKAVVSSIRATAYSRPAYFNILQYRGDLQLTLATAAVLSARFPFVTPPGVLFANKLATDETLRETKALQLIDGGFSDNSGIATANEIIKQLKASDDTKDLAAMVEFHLISFGHSNTALQRQGDPGALPEFVAPFITYETVREARSLGENDAKVAGFDVVHGYQLFDFDFQAPLSWTLSQRMRSQIDARSGGINVDPTVCCSLELPENLKKEFPELVLDVEPLKRYLPSDFRKHPEQFGLRLIAPNVRHFRDVIRVVQDSGWAHTLR